MNSIDKNIIIQPPLTHPLSKGQRKGLLSAQLDTIRNSDEKFQYQLTRNFRKDLLDQLDSFNLEASTQSYVLHQLNQTHDLEGLSFLINLFT